ncbi:hypothetical protein [Photobacterium sp. J15]|uniref:hypothetical protein n=1 Tax=Photobacterium sp. J15 TaxID=265901 RepID=UPI0007E3B0CC|nr:hypothetical protein [Photobacterium sp. J15]
MFETLTYLLSAYAVIGIFVTLYVIALYFITGKTIFESDQNEVMPFRYKVSYVFIMFLMFPYFYIAFIQEIKSLRDNHRLKEKSA